MQVEGGFGLYLNIVSTVDGCFISFIYDVR